MQRLRITLFTLVVTLLAVANVQSGPPQDETIPIIDVHTHTPFTGDTEPTTGVPRTQEQYFKSGVKPGLWVPWLTRRQVGRISTI